MLSNVINGLVIRHSLKLVRHKDIWPLGLKSIFQKNQRNPLFMNISVHVRTVTLSLSSTFFLLLKPTQILKLNKEVLYI